MQSEVRYIEIDIFIQIQYYAVAVLAIGIIIPTSKFKLIKFLFYFQNLVSLTLYGFKFHFCYITCRLFIIHHYRGGSRREQQVSNTPKNIIINDACNHSSVKNFSNRSNLINKCIIICSGLVCPCVRVLVSVLLLSEFGSAGGRSGGIQRRDFD